MADKVLFKSRRFRFSWRITFVCSVLAALMIRASFWQASRHANKLVYIETMRERLTQPIADISSYLNDSSTNWNTLTYRRLKISCSYDFEHEMVLRNRRYEERPGGFVITPCRLAGSQKAIIVSRGFVPFSFMERDKRTPFQKDSQVTFVGLIKESLGRKMFSPQDPPTGDGHAWVDAWLRVNLPAMQKQIPYEILPIYAEVMERDAGAEVVDSILESRAGRDEMLMLGAESTIVGREHSITEALPIPVFDAVISPGRHEGYIYEWAFMAALTLLIGVVLQFRRPRDG